MRRESSEPAWRVRRIVSAVVLTRLMQTLLYQVRPGDYLGQNFGKVTKINESEITLREIAQDAVGEWIERAATLQLQERSK